MTDRDQSKKIDPDNDMPENIKRDPNRDLSHVPGSFNPGNQAGKGRDVEEDKTRHPDDRVKDVTSATTDAVTATANSFGRALRRTIETQPYTAVLIGVGIGWLLGRIHRPF